MENSLNKSQLSSRHKTKKSANVKRMHMFFHVQSIIATIDMYEVESMVLNILVYSGHRMKCQVRNDVSIYLAESTGHDVTVATKFNCQNAP